MRGWLPDRWELWVWLAGLAVVMWSDPSHSHFTVCPLALAGIDWCPGCGLGHAIGHLVRGDWQASWQAHPLAVPALLIIGHRIIKLIFQPQNQNYVRQNQHAATQSRP